MNNGYQPGVRDGLYEPPDDVTDTYLDAWDDYYDPGDEPPVDYDAYENLQETLRRSLER